MTQVFGNASVGQRVERSSKLTIVLLASTNSYALSPPPTADIAGKSSSRRAILLQGKPPLR